MKVQRMKEKPKRLAMCETGLFGNCLRSKRVQEVADEAKPRARQL
jgi:hypothetical protein